MDNTSTTYKTFLIKRTNLFGLKWRKLIGNTGRAMALISKKSFLQDTPFLFT